MTQSGFRAPPLKERAVKKLVALLAAIGCATTGCTDAPPQSASACPGAEIYALYSDFKSARVGSILADGTAQDVTGADLGADVMLAAHGADALLLARDFDTVLTLSPGCGLPQSQVALRASAMSPLLNPQDAARSSDGALWVANFASIPLLRVAPDGSKWPMTLADVDDDGEPQATFVHRYEHDGREEMVTWFARLSNADFTPKSTARIVFVDPKTMRETRRTDTQSWNLFGALDVHANEAYAAAPGSFSSAIETRAGIEQLDMLQGRSTLLVSESTLGGSPTSVRVSGNCGSAIVVDSSEARRTTLVSFDTRSPDRSVRTAIAPTSGYSLTGLAWAHEVLFVGDRQDKRGRVRRFTKSADCTLLETLPPVETRGLPFVLAAVTPPL